VLPIDGRCTPFCWCFSYSRLCGGTNVMYIVRFGKESMAGSLSISTMVHVQYMFCLGRRCGEIGDGGSD